jgi:hypothetical protein
VWGEGTRSKKINHQGHQVRTPREWQEGNIVILFFFLVFFLLGDLGVLGG